MASVDEFWLVDFGTPFPSELAHQRPALVVGPHPFFGDRIPIVFVCPLTTRHRGLSLRVEVEPNQRNGLTATGYVQCEALRSVSEQRMIHRFGHVEADVAAQVSDVIAMLLGY